MGRAEPGPGEGAALLTEAERASWSREMAAAAVKPFQFAIDLNNKGILEKNMHKSRKRIILNIVTGEWRLTV